MKKVLALCALAVALSVAVFAGRAQAILYGTPDDEHTGVGYIVFYDVANIPITRCTGSLVSTRVLLTAAHCSGLNFYPTGPRTPARAQVWFDSPRTGDYPSAGGVPCDGFKGWPCSGGDAVGAPFAHPEWSPNEWVNDIGVVVLTRAVRNRDVLPLAPVGTLDDMSPGAPATIVGFGTQSVAPPPVDQRQRMQGQVRFLGIDPLDPEFAAFTNDHAHGAAACLGDSGGPVLNDNGEIVALISLSDQSQSYCEGTGFHYRTDTVESLQFLARFGVEVSANDGRDKDKKDKDKDKKDRDKQDRDKQDREKQDKEKAKEGHSWSERESDFGSRR